MFFLCLLGTSLPKQSFIPTHIEPGQSIRMHKSPSSSRTDIPTRDHGGQILSKSVGSESTLAAQEQQQQARDLESPFRPSSVGAYRSDSPYAGRDTTLSPSNFTSASGFEYAKMQPMKHKPADKERDREADRDREGERDERRAVVSQSGWGEYVDAPSSSAAAAGVAARTASSSAAVASSRARADSHEPGREPPSRDFKQGLAAESDLEQGKR